MRPYKKKLWGNCLFAAIHLLISGRARQFVAVNSISWFPWHFVAISKQGHALHFQTTLEEEMSAPMFFKGKFVGVRRSMLSQVLKKQNRYVCFTMSSFYFGWLLVIFLMFLPIWTPLILSWSVLNNLRSQGGP